MILVNRLLLNEYVRVAFFALAFIFLYPFWSSLDYDGISLLALCCFSIYLIINEKTTIPLPFSKRVISVLLFSAALLFGGYVFLDIDKLRLLSGAVILCALFANRYQQSTTILLVTLIIILMLPLPYEIEKNVGLWLANKEAILFTEVAQLFHMNVYYLGSQIIAGNQAVTINVNCSGTLLFVPSLMGMAVYAHYKSTSVTQLILIIIAAIPYAFLFNLIRIGILIVMHWNAEEQLVNSFHDLLGVFITFTIWMIPVWFAIGKKDIFQTFSSHKTFLLASIITIVSPILLQVTAGSIQKGFSVNYPYYMDGWIGAESQISKEEASILKADQSFRRDYQNINNDRHVQITFIYHNEASEGLKHSSLYCFQTLGWSMNLVKKASKKNDVSAAVYLGTSFQNKQTITELVIRSKVKGVIRLQMVEIGESEAQDSIEIASKFLQKFQAFQSKGAL